MIASVKSIVAKKESDLPNRLGKYTHCRLQNNLQFFITSEQHGLLPSSCAENAL
jgi:hypothetical protein